MKVFMLDNSLFLIKSNVLANADVQTIVVIFRFKLFFKLLCYKNIQINLNLLIEVQKK